MRPPLTGHARLTRFALLWLVLLAPGRAQADSDGPHAIGLERRPPSPSADRSPTPGGEDPNWVVLLDEGFEAAFPSGSWRAYRRGAVPYRWEEEAYRPHSGNRSAWCVGWSENELEYRQLDPAVDPYPREVETWMVWGPFDARDAEAAVLDFWSYVDTAPGDSLFYGASTDGDVFYGYFQAGRFPAYLQGSLDIAAALGLSDLSGLDEVWIAFYFSSDGDPSTGSGVFVDDVVVRKRVPGPICRLSTDRIEFGPIPVDSTATADLAIFNDGDRDLSGTLDLSCADFEVAGDLTFTVSPRGLVERRIHFTPSAAGAASCLVTLTGTRCSPVTLEGEGIVYQLPSLLHQPPPSPLAAGQPVDLSLRLEPRGTPPPGAPSLTLRYLRSGEGGPEWAETELVANGGNTFGATLPGAEVGLLGAAYYFELEQGGRRARLPEGAPDSTFDLGTFVSAAQLPFLLPGGGEQVGYRMISLPGTVSDRSVSALLVDDFGTYDETKWRFFRYESGSYTEFPEAPADSLALGRAYWILHRDAGRRFDVGAVSSHALEPFEIELEPGWNDVALPFVTPLPVTAASIVGAADGPYTYRGGWLGPTSVNTLEPWEGYSYFNPNGVSATLRIDPVPPALGLRGGLSAPSLAPVWSLRLAARSGEASDPDNVLGIAPNATEGKDPADFVEPRLVGDGIRLALRPPGTEPGEAAEGSRVDGWCSDYRSSERELSTWHIALESRVRDAAGELAPIVVSFRPEGALPKGWVARIVDAQSRIRLDASAPGSLALDAASFRIDPAGGRRSLLVHVGRAERVAEALGEGPEPLSLRVRSLGPNPFRSETRLRLDLPREESVVVRIFDVRGRQVRTAFRGALAAGRHLLRWDGSDDSGGELPSGVYFWDVDVAGERHRERVTRVR